MAARPAAFPDPAGSPDRRRAHHSQTTAPAAVSRDAAAPTRIDQRAPNRSPTQPTTGEPSGVPPRNTAMYKAITRPRSCGAVDSCTVALAAVITVSAKTPTGIRATANNE